MITRTLLLLHTVLIFAACNAQQQHSGERHVTQTATITIGDTVPDIGENIDCILQDRNGNYWIGSNGEGVYRFDGKTLLHITDKHGLCSNFVRAIQQDRKGNLWFTTGDGFCRFDGSAFVDYTAMISNAPKGMLRYANGGLFFGHVNGICFHAGNSFMNFTIHPASYRPSPGDMNRPYSVYSSLVDNAGNVWFGTQSQGVCRYDGRTFSFLTDKDLAGPAVRAIFQDSAGRMWFGNNGGGLYRYDGETLSNITEEHGLGNPEFLKGRSVGKPGSLARVWAINEDKDGSLWIGTIDAGAWRLDGTRLTNYTTKDGLTGNSIRAIHKNTEGELLFVTDGNAICRFDGKTFVPFTFSQ